MKVSKLAFWFLAALYLQQVPLFAEAGVDFLLILVTLAGLRSAPAGAAAWGLGAGLCQDLLSAGWVGPMATAKLAAGLLACFSQRHVYRERVVTQSALVAGAMALQQSVVWLLLLWDGSAPMAEDAMGIWTRSVVSTALAGVLACYGVVKFRRRRHDPATA